MREASLIPLFFLYPLLPRSHTPSLLSLLDEVRPANTYPTHFEGMQLQAVSNRPRLHVMASQTHLAVRKALTRTLPGGRSATPPQPIPHPLHPSCHARAVSGHVKASDPVGSVQVAATLVGHSGCCFAPECRRRKARARARGIIHGKANGRSALAYYEPTSAM